MSVLIAVPCYGGFADVTGVGLFNLAKHLHANGIRHELVTLTNSSLISKVRSRLANLFLHATDFEYLLFIDSDIGFGAGDFSKLWELKAEIVAAPYPMKSLQPSYNFALARSEGKVISHASGLAVQVEQIGTGFMLIHRAVFERLSDRHPELRFRPDPGSSHRAFTPGELERSVHFFETSIDPESRVALSEDLAFCRRAREAGFAIWMRVDTQLTHAGHFVHRGLDLRAEFGELLGPEAAR